MRINITPSPKDGNPTKEQILKFIEEIKDYVSDLKVAYACLNLRKMLGYSLDFNQLAFSVIDTFDALLLLSCPGSGKTFTVREKILMLKLYKGIKGKNILCLAYNKHTAVNIGTMHDALVREVNRKVSGLGELDSEIKSYTFHKFAQIWVKTCRIQCGLVDFKFFGEIMLKESTVQETLKNIITKLNETKGWSINTKIAGELAGYINYHREKMYDANSPDDRLPSEITPEQFTVVFKRYEKTKSIGNMIDFTDCLILFNKLLDNPDFQKRMLDNYSVIIVDEYQDCSPLIVDCLRKMVKIGIKLMAVADDDQSIYDFRGADSKNCLRFEEDFDNSAIMTLTYNRRCKQNIVDFCNEIRDNISTHIDKEVRSNKDGGSVVVQEFSTIERQNLSVIDDLFCCNGTSCLAYRDNADSINLTLQLLQQRVPFKVVKGYEPFNDSLSKSLYEIFSYLARPYSKINAIRALPKLLPLSHEQIEEVFAKYDNYTMPSEPSDIDFGRFRDYAKLSSCVDIISYICKEVKKGKSTYETLKAINGLFNCYYWDFVKEANNFPKEQEARVYEIYKSELDVESFLDYIDTQIDTYETLSKEPNATLLTTFHGTKGLEFDTVIGYNIDSEAMDDEEKRLLYVLCTRAKNNLRLYVKEGTKLFSYLDEYNCDSNGEYTESKVKEKHDVILDEDLFGSTSNSNTKVDEELF